MKDYLDDAISGVSSAISKLNYITEDETDDDINDDFWNLKADAETIVNELESINERLEILKETNQWLNQ